MKKRDISLVITDSENETKVVLIFQAFLEFILGVFLVVYPDKTGNILFIVIGALMTGYGLFDVIAFVTNNRPYSFRQGLMTGVLIMLLGVAFIVQAQELRNLISIILGALILIESVVNARRSILIKEFGFRLWAVPFILSLIGAVLGISISVYPDLFQNIILTMIGVVIILESVLDIWAIHRLTKLKNRIKKYVDDARKTVYIDTDD